MPVAQWQVPCSNGIGLFANSISASPMCNNSSTWRQNDKWHSSRPEQWLHLNKSPKWWQSDLCYESTDITFGELECIHCTWRLSTQWHCRLDILVRLKSLCWLFITFNDNILQIFGLLLQKDSSIYHKVARNVLKINVTPCHRVNVKRLWGKEYQYSLCQ